MKYQRLKPVLYKKIIYDKNTYNIKSIYWIIMFVCVWDIFEKKKTNNRQMRFRERNHTNLGIEQLKLNSDYQKKTSVLPNTKNYHFCFFY